MDVRQELMTWAFCSVCRMWSVCTRTRVRSPPGETGYVIALGSAGRSSKRPWLKWFAMAGETLGLGRESSCLSCHREFWTEAVQQLQRSWHQNLQVFLAPWSFSEGLWSRAEQGGCSQFSWSPLLCPAVSRYKTSTQMNKQDNGPAETPQVLWGT